MTTDMLLLCYDITCVTSFGLAPKQFLQDFWNDVIPMQHQAKSAKSVHHCNFLKTNFLVTQCACHFEFYILVVKFAIYCWDEHPEPKWHLKTLPICSAAFPLLSSMPWLCGHPEHASMFYILSSPTLRPTELDNPTDLQAKYVHWEETKSLMTSDGHMKKEQLTRCGFILCKLFCSSKTVSLNCYGCLKCTL